MHSMTYGTLPSRALFDRHWRRVVGPDDDLFLHLKGGDARLVDQLQADEEALGLDHGLPYAGPGGYDEEQVWEIVVDLTNAWKAGVDPAGDLASSILYVLDFEWV